MLVIHHLGVSQSERIVWLLEELELPYKLVLHTRDPLLSPKSLTSLPGNETGKAPFLEDTDAGITMTESGAICEYIIHKYGGGRLALKPSDKSYSEYLRFLHYANGTLQAEMVTSMFVSLSGAPPEAPIFDMAKTRIETVMKALDTRLKNNKWLAGDDFTAADIMNLYATSTQRHFGPQVDLSPYSNILRWMKDCGERQAYQRAMEKGDPEMRTLLGADASESLLMVEGGIKSNVWKK